MWLRSRVRGVASRWLPQVAKRAIRRVIPVSLLAVQPTVRRFTLRLPRPPAELGPAIRDHAPRGLRIEAPGRAYVPRLLEASGIAGYEPETMAAFLASITARDAAVAFDVGANVGLFSLVASALTRAMVVGFEPTPDLALTFRSIAAVNGLACTVEPIALGERDGRAPLYLSAKTDSSNSLAAGFRPATGVVDVPVERLDAYVARTGLLPAVVKIDTETTEPDVLAGGVTLLRVHRPWIICEVLAGRTEAALSEAFDGLGYRFHRLTGDAPPTPAPRLEGDPTYRHRDWLFTPGALPEPFARHYAAWREAIAEAN